MNDLPSRRSFIHSVGLGFTALGLTGTTLGQDEKIQGFDDTAAKADLSKQWKPVSDRKIRVGIAGYCACRTPCQGWLFLLLFFGLLGCASPDRIPWESLDVKTEGPHVGSAMVWEPTRGVLLLHGGQNRNWEMLPETWEWFPGSDAWRLVTDASQLNPGARTSHAMVWDSARERTILFGGTDLNRDFADTWAFDGSSSRWERLDTSGNPPPRSQHGMIYDPVTDQVIIFGGRGTDQKRLHDTWLLNLYTLEWIQPASTKAAPHPQARDHVQMARDSLSGIIVMRGSSLGPGLPDETWHFDAHARSWSLAQTNQEPQEMGHGFLRSVERLGGLVLFGFHASWETSGGYSPQTWVYRPQAEAWTLLQARGVQPESPMDHGQAASDGQHLFLLGGFGGDDVPPDAGLTPRGAMWKL